MELRQGLSIQEKLRILADAAKYDVACTSSGVDRKGMKGSLGNSKACGICHSFSADGRCISLLKVLLTNHCVYDCKYCANRVSNDTERTAFTPRELCELTVEFYKETISKGCFSVQECKRILHIRWKRCVRRCSFSVLNIISTDIFM